MRRQKVWIWQTRKAGGIRPRARANTPGDRICIADMRVALRAVAFALRFSPRQAAREEIAAAQSLARADWDDDGPSPSDFPLHTDPPAVALRYLVFLDRALDRFLAVPRLDREWKALRLLAERKHAPAGLDDIAGGAPAAQSLSTLGDLGSEQRPGERGRQRTIRRTPRWSQGEAAPAAFATRVGSCLRRGLKPRAPCRLYLRDSFMSVGNQT